MLRWHNMKRQVRTTSQMLREQLTMPCGLFSVAPAYYFIKTRVWDNYWVNSDRLLLAKDASQNTSDGGAEVASVALVA